MAALQNRINNLLRNRKGPNVSLRKTGKAGGFAQTDKSFGNGYQGNIVGKTIAGVKVTGVDSKGPSSIPAMLGNKTQMTPPGPRPFGQPAQQLTDAPTFPRAKNPPLANALNAPRLRNLTRKRRKPRATPSMNQPSSGDLLR